MPSIQKKPAGRLVLAVILSLGLLDLSGCESTEPSLVAPPPESELHVRLYQLARAYETLDLERIAPFYADDVTSTTKEAPRRSDVGIGQLRGTVGESLGQLRTLKVTLTNAVQARFSGRSVDTVQGFSADWVTRGGRKGSWNGRHAATWKGRRGIWQIVHEELLGLPAGEPGESASFHPIFPTPVERLEEARRQVGEDSVTVRPEPVRTVTPGPGPAVPPDRTPEPAPARSPASAPPPIPTPIASPPAPQKVALLVNPDWTGEPVYVLQLSSSKDRPGAQRYAAEMAKETGLPARAVAVDLGEKGTWYRTVVGEFKTAEEALARRARFLAEKRSVGFVFRMVRKS